MQTPQDAPEPSPAPTLASDFPGFFPKTPLEDPDQEHSSTSSYLDALKPGEHTAETLQSAGKALLGAAAGFVVGGPIGAAVGGGLLGLREVEREGLLKRSGTPTPTNSRPGTAKANEPEKEKKDDIVVDEAHRPKFDEQLEKEKQALAESPAQKLIGGDEEEGARLTGEGAIGGALLAGAAGAKVEENEVRSPTTEDDELERKGGVEPKDVAIPPTPDFGTPSIEKEQAALAASPAQQLLRQDTSSSSVTQAETALLAGAAGAKLADKEVDEPSKAPIDEVAEKSAEAGAPLGLPEKKDNEEEEETQAHAVPLEREISSPPSPSTLHPTSLDLSRPDLGPSHRPSSSSFAAAVLAAGEGVHTPTETGAAQFGGFGAGGREIRASDVAEDEDEKLNSSHPSPSPPSASTFLSSSATAPSHPVEPGTVQPVETNDQTSGAHQDEPKREAKGKEDEEVVHNPAPLLPAALAGTAAGVSLLGPELVSNAPQDFEPYSAPVVEQSAEAKVAAATPLPETPGLETAPTKSFAPAILGSGGIYPNSPLTQNANTAALSSTDTIPATINAQNYVAPAAAVVADEEVVQGRETEGARSPEEEIPLKEALEEGPDSSAAVVPAPVAATTGGNVESVPLEPVEVEEKKDKGKGREVVEDVALVGAGAGAGVLAGETLRREDGPTHPAASTAFTQTPAPPALTTQPTSETLDSVLETSTPHDSSLATSPLDDQRAFPPIPHFNRPSALNSTDEPVLDPSVDGASSSHKALDPKVLAASSPATSPEQAGFTNVPKDGALTGAMQDFAHLSQPSKVAEEKALAETAATEPVETVEKREYEEGTGTGGLPLAAGAAGLAAGGAGAAVLAHDHATPSAATTAPPVGAGEQALPAGAVATPIVAATAPAQQQPVSQAVQPTPVAAQQPVATPVSRFTEQTNATPTRNAAVSGYDTPSSTRAVKGTPAASTTPDSSVFRDGAATPTPASGSTTLPPAAAAAGVSPTELANVSLLEAGVIEQSKHMKIQTTRNEEGHKRLHRKSLSGSQFAPSNRRSSLSKATPIAPAQQQEQYYAQAQQPREVQVAPSGVTGADGAVVQNRPGLQTIHSEREIRRDRMLDDIVGVRDPTYAAVPSTSSYQPRLSSSSNNSNLASTGTPLVPMRTSTPPVAPSAHAHSNVHPHNTIVNPHNLGSVVAPASPTGSTGVGRKLSKRRPSGAEGEVKKEGFFSRLLHGGSGVHERRSSVGSNHSPAGSPRTSVEQSRV